MKRAKWIVAAACTTLLCASTALAVATAQQQCDNARVTAWRKYTSCVDAVVAKDAKGLIFDGFKAFWKCRHAYFKKWTGFQTKASLIGSTCIGARFTDNGDQTVTDNLNGLMWEKKDNAGGIHDKDNFYTWSTGAPYKGNGTAYATFLTGAGTGLNVAGFAGAKDWRLPALAELQTIMLDFACTGAGGGVTCTCSPGPCVDSALDAANTQSSVYWSATGYVPYALNAWGVDFFSGVVFAGNKSGGNYVRAVRGGL